MIHPMEIPSSAGQQPVKAPGTIRFNILELSSIGTVKTLFQAILHPTKSQKTLLHPRTSISGSRCIHRNLVIVYQRRAHQALDTVRLTVLVLRGSLHQRGPKGAGQGTDSSMVRWIRALSRYHELQVSPLKREHTSFVLEEAARSRLVVLVTWTAMRRHSMDERKTGSRVYSVRWKGRRSSAWYTI